MGGSAPGAHTVAPLRRAALYDPKADRWRDVGPMPVRLASPVVARLADGRAFMEGEQGAELYDPGHSYVAGDADQRRSRPRRVGEPRRWAGACPRRLPGDRPRLRLRDRDLERARAASRRSPTSRSRSWRMAGSSPPAATSAATAATRAPLARSPRPGCSIPRAAAEPDLEGRSATIPPMPSPVPWSAIRGSRGSPRPRSGRASSSTSPSAATPWSRAPASCPRATTRCCSSTPAWSRSRTR